MFGKLDSVNMPSRHISGRNRAEMGQWIPIQALSGTDAEKLIQTRCQNQQSADYSMSWQMDISGNIIKKNKDYLGKSIREKSFLSLLLLGTILFKL